MPSGATTLSVSDKNHTRLERHFLPRPERHRGPIRNLDVGGLDAVNASGLTNAEFARHIGTSASRLSTCLSGKVTPSAALLLRIERVAESAG